MGQWKPGWNALMADFEDCGDGNSDTESDVEDDSDSEYLEYFKSSYMTILILVI
jgi:hypothetical protein